MKSSFKTAAKRVLEAIVVLTLVILAFLAILLTLNEVFPTGQSLFNLVRPGGDYRGQDDPGKGVRDLRLATDTGEQLLGENVGVTAVLAGMKNSVKSKRAAQITWQAAEEGMPLYDRDAIQTFGKSTARLSFEGGSFLELKENSLIIVKKLERDLFLRENRTVIVLINGQLTGEVATAQRESFNLEVVAPGAVTRVRSTKDRNRPARFQMAVRPDESSILTVLEGTADLIFEGEPMEVGVNQSVKVQPGKAPVFISPPPRPPDLISPEDGAAYSFRDIAPMVSFIWSGIERAAGYHFIMATDRQFENILYEDTIGSARFFHGNLRTGEYYWRVSSTSSDQEGEFSKTRHFKLIQDLDPPPLKVHFPDSPLKDNSFELRGTTEPDAQVFVSGAPANVNDRGEFVHSLSLQPGPNVTVVEAVDKAGNVAYLSQIINVEF